MTQEEERERKKQDETQSRQGTGDRRFRRKPTTEPSQTRVETGPHAGARAYSNAHLPGPPEPLRASPLCSERPPVFQLGRSLALSGLPGQTTPHT